MIGRIKRRWLRRAVVVLVSPVVFLIFALFALVGAVWAAIEDICDAW